MGLVYVTMEVRGDGTACEVDFLVDSGAIYSVLPRRVWKTLRLTPKRALRFTLADGSSVRRQVSECRFVYGALDAVSPVILGERRDAPLLGAVTLESLGLVLNPFDRSLRPMRMLLAAIG